MMIAKAFETCWQLLIRDKTYFIQVHFLVLLHKFKNKVRLIIEGSVNFVLNS
jgi:hypothetical protein